ncbi:MAG: GNAT family N-acetyltransferase [Acidobacteria bacterium]|nr:GNAT family N-acetyltransferase [Acidobacteriota bacterium]
MGFSLHTERLTLRDYEAHDYGLVHELFLHPAMSVHHLSDQASADYVSEHFQFGREQTRWHPRAVYDLAIVAAGEALGVCGLKQDFWQRESASLNWHICPAHWQHGYATEAATRLLEFGFAELNLSVITASAFADNAASLRVMEKIGLRAAHNAGTAAWWRGLIVGEARPVVRYALTKEEWLASRVYAAASHFVAGGV